MKIEPFTILLSLQRALLDSVTESLRQVSYEIKGKTIILYFFYNEDVSDLEEELAGDVAAEVIADFPEEYKVDWKVTTIYYPEKIHAPGQVVFSRYEPDPNSG
jgi:hypothetical protein